MAAMTETDTTTKNGGGAAADKAEKAGGDINAEVLRQMDYYFGDFNLPKDKFLKNAIEEAKARWVTFEFVRLAISPSVTMSHVKRASGVGS